MHMIGHHNKFMELISLLIKLLQRSFDEQFRLGVCKRASTISSI